MCCFNTLWRPMIHLAFLFFASSNHNCLQTGDRGHLWVAVSGFAYPEGWSLQHSKSLNLPEHKYLPRNFIACSNWNFTLQHGPAAAIGRDRYVVWPLTFWNVQIVVA